MSYRIITFCFIAVCSWGQLPSNRLPSGQLFGPASSPRLSRADEPADSLSAGEAFVATPRTPPGTISAEELAHPISRKGIKLLGKAQDYLRAGDHGKAIDALQHALTEPTAAPYVHGMLGTEYLKLGRIPDAVAELEQAVQFRPHHAPTRSNLGFALYLAGERERGEQEVRKALLLDSGNAKTRYTLNLIQGGREGGRGQ